MTKYYPMMLNIENEKCLVIGGGNVAYRKLVDLIEYGGIVTLVSKGINKDINLAIENGVKGFIYIKDIYKEEYIKDAFIVIAATNDSCINLLIARDCEKKNILVNVIDDLESSRFVVPAKVKRGDLTITISTNGKCPFYSKLLKNELEIQYDAGYGIIVSILGDFRKQLLSNRQTSPKTKDIMASLDIEYYISRLKEIGEIAVREEMELKYSSVCNKSQ
jgi:precorrin-2 dehydrogenase/sirohydrochlorin ferrochelatase